MIGDVLVVDDCPVQRLLLRLALERDAVGRVVGEASTPPVAADLAGSLQPDVVLYDLGMPGWDAVEGVRAVAAAAGGARLVLLATGDGHDSEAARCMEDGLAVGLLDKATPPLELGAAVDGLLRREGGARASAEVELPADVTSAREARRFAADVLASWDAAPDVIDLVVLLVSEVASNAVRHARSTVRLRLERLAERIRVEVVDAEPGHVRRRRSTPSAQSGRGFEMVDAAAAAWGIDHLALGKRVWFEVAVG